MRAILAFAVTLAAPASAQDAQIGATLFQDHCAVFHGTEADGRGPMSSALLIQPTDLTTLAAMNDGVFPTRRVVWRIDGREPLVSHGSPMWIFGDLFEGPQGALKAETGQPILTSQPIADLTVYLRGIQVP